MSLLMGSGRRYFLDFRLEFPSVLRGKTCLETPSIIGDFLEPPPELIRDLGFFGCNYAMVGAN